MTDAANDRAMDERRLANAIDLYRDLSENLAARLPANRRHPGEKAEGKGLAGVLTGHWQALQTVLDLEAKLGKRNGTDAGGRAVELDLGEARAEILARLARWHAGEGS